MLGNTGDDLTNMWGLIGVGSAVGFAGLTLVHRLWRGAFILVGTAFVLSGLCWSLIRTAAPNVGRTVTTLTTNPQNWFVIGALASPMEKGDAFANSSGAQSSRCRRTYSANCGTRKAYKLGALEGAFSIYIGRVRQNSGSHRSCNFSHDYREPILPTIACGSGEGRNPPVLSDVWRRHLWSAMRSRTKHGDAGKTRSRHCLGHAKGLCRGSHSLKVFQP
jgi:hypothetical protein